MPYVAQWQAKKDAAEHCVCATDGVQLAASTPQQELEMVTEEAARAMDDMANWAQANVVHLAAVPPSLTTHREIGKLTAAMAQQKMLMGRAAALTTEASIMLNEQWSAYGGEAYSDGYRPSRNRPADVSECMTCWGAWDADGYKLYQSLLHRAECLFAEAKAVKS